MSAPAAPVRTAEGPGPATRVGRYDWNGVGQDLEAYGSAVLAGLLDPEE